MVDGHLFAFSLSVSLNIIVVIANAKTNVTNVDSVLIATSIHGGIDKHNKQNTSTASTSSTSDQSRYFLSNFKDSDRIVFDRPSVNEMAKDPTTNKPVLSSDDVTRTFNASGEYTFR